MLRLSAVLRCGWGRESVTAIDNALRHAWLTPGYLRQPPGFSMVSHVRLCLAVFAILVIQWEGVDVPTSSDDF